MKERKCRVVSERGQQSVLRRKSQSTTEISRVTKKLNKMETEVIDTALAAGFSCVVGMEIKLDLQIRLLKVRG